MATIRMSEKEAIERGFLKPEEATEKTKSKKEKVRYIRVPVVEHHVKNKIVGPGIWHVAVFVLAWLLGYTMAIHGFP